MERKKREGEKVEERRLRREGIGVIGMERWREVAIVAVAFGVLGVLFWLSVVRMRVGDVNENEN